LNISSFEQEIQELCVFEAILLRKLIPKLQFAFDNLISIIELQLFLVCIYIPVIVAWGLPFSIIGIISTPLFSPLFTVFLLICTILFFTELFGIPNQMLVLCLEQLTKIWVYALSWGGDHWLVGFAYSHYFVLYAVPVAALYIMHSRLKKGYALCGYLVILVLFYAITHLLQKNEFLVKSIHCDHERRGDLFVFACGSGAVLVDDGMFSGRAPNRSWCDYTLMPLITKATGFARIDYIIFPLHKKQIHKTMEHFQKMFPKIKAYAPGLFNAQQSTSDITSCHELSYNESIVIDCGKGYQLTIVTAQNSSLWFDKKRYHTLELSITRNGTVVEIIKPNGSKKHL
jgi:hypothetical protein